eukprot:COSAG06_NODE_56107_length_286_cov_1.037433_1_plen_86_part_01
MCRGAQLQMKRVEKSSKSRSKTSKRGKIKNNKGQGEEEEQSEAWEEMCEDAGAEPSEGLGLAQLREMVEEGWSSGTVRQLHAQLPQ